MLAPRTVDEGMLGAATWARLTRGYGDIDEVVVVGYGFSLGFPIRTADRITFESAPQPP